MLQWDLLIILHYSQFLNQYHLVLAMIQYLEDLTDKIPDPLRTRVFGGKIQGNGFKKIDDYTLVLDSPKDSSHIQISTLTIPYCDNIDNISHNSHNYHVN